MGVIHEQKNHDRGSVCGNNKGLECIASDAGDSAWGIGAGQAASAVRSGAATDGRGNITGSSQGVGSVSGKKLSAKRVRASNGNPASAPSVHSEKMGPSGQKTGILKMKMKTLANAIQKGGQGKTMATCHLAFDGARRGLRVVVIDLDPQGNASYTLEAHASGLFASQMFDESPDLVPSFFADRDNTGITLIHNDDGLANIEKLELEDAATLLRTHVDALSEFFDVCLIDTPPFLSNVMASALLSADFVMSPVEMEPYSLQGMEKMVAVIQNLREANPALQFIGMLPNRYNVKIPRHVENMKILRDEYAELVMPFDIRQRDSIAEALGNQIPVWKVKKTAARDATKEVRVMTQYVFEKMEVIQ
ncbi:ParA family protein [Pseudomonas sp. S2.OTC.A_B10]|uniref:ParA family protein n=1 Tax=Pseudomonas sp. S2.OTC.A_B10 TaxID=3237018 RepID=UPI003CFA343C